MSYDETLLKDAIHHIRYDESIPAGDARILMRAAQADIRNGVRNRNTEHAVYLARLFLGLAVAQ